MSLFRTAQVNNGDQPCYILEVSVDSSHSKPLVIYPFRSNSTLYKSAAETPKQPATRSRCKNSRFTLDEKAMLVDLKENQGLADLGFRIVAEGLFDIQLDWIFGTNHFWSMGQLSFGLKLATAPRKERTSYSLYEILTLFRPFFLRDISIFQQCEIYRL